MSLETVDPPEDEQLVGDLGAEVAPRQEFSSHQATKNEAVPELALCSSARDVSVQSSTLVAGMDNPSPLPVVIQRLGGSAEPSRSSDPSSTFTPPSSLDESSMSPLIMKQEHDTDMYTESRELQERVQKLQERVQKLTGENQTLRQKFVNLRLREREIQIKEKEDALEVKRRESELALEVKRRESELALEVKRRESELELKEREHAFKEQQRKDDYLAKEQELQVKDRELRARSLELQTEQDQHQLKVEKFELKQREQRDLELRRELQLQRLMAHDMQLQKEVDRLESENSDLKSKVRQLEYELDEPLLSSDTTDINLPAVEASSSYSNGVSRPVQVVDEGRAQFLPRASLEPSNQTQVGLESLDLLECVGRGSYGTVHHARHLLDGAEYALKIIKIKEAAQSPSAALKEVRALAKLSDHPRIVRYYYSWKGELPKQWMEKGVQFNSSSSDQESSPDQETDSGPPICLCILTELCQGNLWDWLKDTERSTKRKKSTVLKYIQQILEAVLYIHQEGYIHRDLKPHNILFSLKDKNIKVGDFGFTTQSETEFEATDITNQKHSVNAGTMPYRAPEQMFGGRNYNNKVDIFALGVILYEANVFFPEGQTEGQWSQVLMQLKGKELLKLPNFVKALQSEAFLIQLLITHDPTKRPTAEEVYQSSQWKEWKKSIEEQSDSALVRRE